MALCGRMVIKHGVDLPCHINDMKPTGSPKAAYDQGVVQSGQVSRCGSVLPTTTQGVAVRICLQTLQRLHPPVLTAVGAPSLLRSTATWTGRCRCCSSPVGKQGTLTFPLVSSLYSSSLPSFLPSLPLLSSCAAYCCFVLLSLHYCF
jgi:hypothetical protein